MKKVFLIHHIYIVLVSQADAKYNVEMELLKASEKHNQELIQFLGSQSIRGEIELRFMREEDFGVKLKLLGNEHETYFIRDENDQISACASLFFEDVFIDSEIVKVCWITDLRIGDSKKASYHWMTRFFNKVFERASTLGAQHIFTTIFKEDRESINSLTRPRKRNRELPQFLHMRNFDLVSLHAKLPGSRPLLTGIKIKKMNPNRLEELSQYLNSHSKHRVLGKIYSPENLATRLESWTNFHEENFYICLDKRDRIVGSFALWDTSAFEKMQLINMNDRARNFYHITKLLSLFGLARPLPKIGNCLNFNYLTHLYCDNSDIFEKMIHFAFRKSKSKFLIYPQFEDHYIQLPPKRFLHQNLSFALYTILPQGERPSEKLRQKPFSPPPDIDIFSL
ncbi:MAG: hypothetical protein CL674_05410 [Bdellovibrionaceae bacterium]|nr:hypothetical protein [Pseudobdellovibrionaceae bacterium]